MSEIDRDSWRNLRKRNRTDRLFSLVVQDSMLVCIGNGADAIYAPLPDGATDRAQRGHLGAHGIRSRPQRMSGAISKTVDGHGDLSNSTLDSPLSRPVRRALPQPDQRQIIGAIKGHIVYVISGSLVIEHEDETRNALSTGKSWHAPDDAKSPHRVLCVFARRRRAASCCFAECLPDV
jgi:hypothetical protein